MDNPVFRINLLEAMVEEQRELIESLRSELAARRESWRIEKEAMFERLSSAERALAARDAEVERLREKNRELNGRWQRADKAYRDGAKVIEKLSENIEGGTPWVGGSLGRCFIAYSLELKIRELVEKDAEVERLRGVVDKFTETFEQTVGDAILRDIKMGWVYQAAAEAAKEADRE